MAVSNVKSDAEVFKKLIVLQHDCKMDKRTSEPAPGLLLLSTPLIIVYFKIYVSIPELFTVEINLNSYLLKS